MAVVTDYTALLQGSSWAGFETAGTPMFITFSFPTTSPASNADPGAMGAAASTFQAFDNGDKAVVRQALQEWADACGLVLLEVKPGEGDINFGWYDFSTTAYDGFAGVGFNPGGLSNSLSDGFFLDHREFGDLGGNIMINSDYEVGGLPAYGLLLHEIGHALGLKHPFEPRSAPYDVTLDPLLDNTSNTVMSYTGAEPTQLGQLDTDAAAYLYGAATSDPVAGVDYTWDSVTRTLTQTGDATGETTIGISTLDNISGGGGTDSLFGLDSNDTLNGGAEADGLFGGSGNDSMLGGTGNDTADAGTGNDQVNGNAGDDEIWGWTGNDTLTGSDGNDWISGDDGSDRLSGGLGNDVIYGGAGTNTIDGDDGDDYLVGGSGTDKITAGAGADLVWGDAGNDREWGGDGNDQLSGDDGNDQLFGEAHDDNMFGGAGKDKLTGGAGSDWLNGGTGADQFIFDAGWGIDYIWDFEDAIDKLVFSAVPGVTGIGNLALSQIDWSGTPVVEIDVTGQGTVYVTNVTLAQITAADMLFA